MSTELCYDCDWDFYRTTFSLKVVPEKDKKNYTIISCDICSRCHPKMIQFIKNQINDTQN